MHITRRYFEKAACAAAVQLTLAILARGGRDTGQTPEPVRAASWPFITGYLEILYGLRDLPVPRQSDTGRDWW